MAINHTELPFDEITEVRILPGDYADRVACRIMQNGWEMGVWIEAEHEGRGPIAQKILAVNDLLAACQAVLALPANEPGRITCLAPQIRDAVRKAIGQE